MTNYTVGGSYAAPKFDYLDIKFYKCKNSTDNGNHCKTDAEIDSKIASSTLQMRFVNKYVDFSDYSHPIKPYIEEEFFWELVP